MLGSVLLAAATFQVGPFYEQKPDYIALRPIVAVENAQTDILWPLFTCHSDWWRFCYIVNWQTYPQDKGYQFSLLPIWFNGRDEESLSYAGLFPIWGHHPHILMMYDVDFALWPLWTHYKMPRGRDWLETNSILFPFFSWRSDGAWSFWPIYGVNYQRESDHRYILWPIATWASYRKDRDTAGEGNSWMIWPLYGQVRREREEQYMVLPPLFSFAQVWSRPWAERGNSGPEIRIRAPWPFFEYENSLSRERLSVWPLYEKSVIRDYRTGEVSSSVMRFGWKLIELYDDETRVFPFYASGRGHTRIWPFYENEETPEGFDESRYLALFPIRWVPAVDRNWAKFWTFYETKSSPLYTDHSLLWGIIRWRTNN